MGGWFLEIGKMALYLSFPVLTFHYFNSPEYFEKFVIEKKREFYPHEDELHREELQALFRDIRTGNLDEKLAEYEIMKTNLEIRKQNNEAANIA